MKAIKLLGYALVAMTCSAVFVGCGDDDNEATSQQGGQQGGDPSNTTTMTMSEQKSFLEQTARELENKVKASDFQALSDLLQYVRDNYTNEGASSSDYYRSSGDGYDMSVLEEWFDNSLDACEVGTPSNKTIRRLLTTANFTGLFSAGPNGWQKDGTADYLQFTFRDKSGNNCVLKVVASANYTPVHNSILDEEDYHWDYYTYTKVLDMRYENTIGVPQSVNVTLTQGANTLVDTKVTTSLSMRSQEADLSSDNYTVSVDAKVCGYQVLVDRLNFIGDQTLSVTTTILKGAETLVWAQASVSGKVRLNSSNDFSVREVGQASASVNVLGKVQVRGTVSNIDDFIDYCDEAEDYRRDENLFKDYMNKANALLNLNVYYNNSSASSAQCKLLASAYRAYDGTRWESAPALFFNDGTSYSFESFFDETTYKHVTNNFETLLEDFEELFK